MPLVSTHQSGRQVHLGVMMEMPQARGSHLEPLQPPAHTMALQAVWREVNGKDAGQKWAGSTKSVFAEGIAGGKVWALKGFLLA